MSSFQNSNDENQNDRSRLSSVLDGQNMDGTNSAQSFLGKSENIEQLESELTVLEEPAPEKPEETKKFFRFFSRK